MSVGILGGSFNPVTAGHLYIAQQAIKQLKLDEVWFVPTGNHPTKTAIGDKTRLKILKESLKIDRRFRMIDYEVKLKSKCYTINTLTYLQKKYPNTEFVLLIGGDQAQDFYKWHRSLSIVGIVRVVVIARKGYKLPATLKGVVTCMKVPDMMEISSSMIREFCQNQTEFSEGDNKPQVNE